jgi:hypothetical protein
VRSYYEGRRRRKSLLQYTLDTLGLAIGLGVLAGFVIILLVAMI